MDELFEQGLLHISEPDLVYVDGPPHSPCPSSASFSSSLLPSPELYPVRLQEVTLQLNPFFLTKSSSSSFITRYPYDNKRVAWWHVGTEKNTVWLRLGQVHALPDLNYACFRIFCKFDFIQFTKLRKDNPETASKTLKLILRTAAKFLPFI